MSIFSMSINFLHRVREEVFFTQVCNNCFLNIKLVNAQNTWYFSTLLKRLLYFSKQCKLTVHNTMRKRWKKLLMGLRFCYWLRYAVQLTGDLRHRLHFSRENIYSLNKQNPATWHAFTYSNHHHLNTKVEEINGARQIIVKIPSP